MFDAFSTHVCIWNIEIIFKKGRSKKENNGEDKPNRVPHIKVSQQNLHVQLLYANKNIKKQIQTQKILKALCNIGLLFLSKYRFS
jgi:hypothetical protein